jgi:plasmid stabilization system protein ParE
LDDLKEQVAFIAQDNPAAARRVADRIRDTGKSLGDMATGRPGRVAGSYEKPVARLPYIIAYALTLRGGREVVAILRVIHTARDWPEENWPA